MPQKRKRQILEKEQAEKKLEGETQQGNVGYFKRTKNPSTTSLGKLQKTIRPTELLTPDSSDLFLLRLDDWYVELRGVNAVTTDTKLSWYEGAIEISQAFRTASLHISKIDSRNGDWVGDRVNVHKENAESGIPSVKMHAGISIQIQNRVTNAKQSFFARENFFYKKKLG